MSAARARVLASMAAAALPIRKRRRDNFGPTDGSRIAVFLSRCLQASIGRSRSKPGAVPAPDVAVDDVERPLACQHAPDFARASGLEPDERLLAVPRDVRRDDDVVAPAQRM